VSGRFLSAATAMALLLLFMGDFKQSIAAASGRPDHLLIAVKKPVVPTNDPLVIMETSKGALKILIFRKDAPITAGNFLDLVRRGFYNGLSFHRYEAGFLLQGGDPRGDGTGSYVDPQTRTERLIPLEINPALKHSEAGMLAMSRTGDPNSGSCQFYITLAPSPKLDGDYAVFGKVVEGMPVVMSIRKNDKIVHAEIKEPAGK
jgi:peptidyl-prolyl cis-trans isomerase B (cyclophilin B)